jgi:GYF domain 2
MSDDDTRDWYYERGGSRRGPNSADDIRALYASGDLAYETLVWNPSFGSTWKPLKEAGILSAGGWREPPPLPSTHVSNAFAWALVAVPLIGTLVERILADADVKLPPTLV